MSEHERRVEIAYGLTVDEAWTVLTHAKTYTPGIRLNAEEKESGTGFCLFATWNDKTVEALRLIGATDVSISVVVEGIVTQTVIKALVKALVKAGKRDSRHE